MEVIMCVQENREHITSKILNILKTISVIYGLLSIWILQNCDNFETGMAYIFSKSSNNLVIVLVFSFLMYLFENNNLNLKSYKWYEYFTAGILGIIFIISVGFQKFDTILFVRSCGIQVLFAVICWTFIILFLYEILFCRVVLQGKIEYQVSVQKIMIFLLVCWLPYIIIFYPGATSWDGMYQLNQYQGVQELTNKNPVIVTYLMGIFVQIGSAIGNQNLGLFFYTFAQTLFLAYVLGLGLALVSTQKCKADVFYITCFGAAIFPIPLFSTYVLLKDGFYCAFCTLFCILILKICIEKKKFWHSKINIFLFVLSELGVMIFRKNGIYVVILTTLALLICEMQWKKILFISLLCILCYKTSDYVVEDVMNIPAGGDAEIYSLPLQQVTRYYINYGIDISEEEKQVLLEVLNIDTCAEVYNEFLSDPVKGQFSNEASSKQILAFLKLWLGLFFKHPLVYVDAFLGNANSYLEPTGIMISERGFFYINHVLPNDAYDFTFGIEAAEQLRQDYRQFLGYGENIPFLGVLFHPGLYTWWLLGITCVFLKKKKVYIKCLVPLYVTLLVCFVSPVNGAVRYALPLIETIPIISIMCKTENVDIRVTH